MSKQLANDKSPQNSQKNDNVIKNRILKELSRVPNLDTSDVHTEVSKAIVTLSGTVTGKEALDSIAGLVAGVKGVVQVNNQLDIRSGGIAAIISQIASDASNVVRGNKPGE